MFIYLRDNKVFKVHQMKSVCVCVCECVCVRESVCVREKE